MKKDYEKNDQNLSELERIKLKNRAELTLPQKINLFFDYNIWKLIIAFFIAGVAFISFYQCSKNVKPDISVLYLGEYMYSSDAELSMEEYLAPFIEDINGDGKVFCDVISVAIPSMDEQPDYYMSVIQKRAIEVFVGESDIMVISPNQLLEITTPDEDGEGGIDTFLADITDYAGGLSADGYTIPIKSTKLADAPGFSYLPDDYMLCLRFESESPFSKDTEAYKKRRSESKKLFAHLCE